MSSVRRTEHFSCTERKSKYRFHIDEKSLAIEEITTRLRPRVSNFRDYTELAVRDASDRVAWSSICSWQVRELTPEETTRYAGSDIAAAVTWQAGWSDLWGSGHPLLTKDFVVDFFCFYKNVLGRGKKVGDLWKDVLVYVDLSISQ